MMLTLLLLVPLTAMGLVLGLSRLEDSLLRVPVAPVADDLAPAATAVLGR